MRTKVPTSKETSIKTNTCISRVVLEQAQHEDVSANMPRAVLGLVKNFDLFVWLVADGWC
jgi:hypothetical protein